MEFEKYVEEMKKIYTYLHNYIEDENSTHDNFETYLQKITNELINDNSSKLKVLLRIITKISKNHQRFPRFNEKINQIILRMILLL